MLPSGRPVFLVLMTNHQNLQRVLCENPTVHQGLEGPVYVSSCPTAVHVACVPAGVVDTCGPFHRRKTSLLYSDFIFSLPLPPRCISIQARTHIRGQDR